MKIDSLNQLRELYGDPRDRAKFKVLTHLDKHCIHFITNSPFAVIATTNEEGKMDASPRGGHKGFVKIIDENKIVIPDSKGNNRLDSLVNILETGRIGMLFFIPGIDESLRLNGSAVISTDHQYLNLFTEERNLPKTAIIVNIEEVFLHCAKAFMRSRLWDQELMADPASFPSMGQMLKDQLGSGEEAESREAMINRYQKDL